MKVEAFLGSNTPQGFYGYFEETFKTAKTVILKGSPGSGKSTLIKKVGSKAEELGLDVEYYHCSGDVNSLDGVYVPALGHAVLDGTSPHALDAPSPLLNEAVVNLIERANEGYLEAHRAEVESLISHKKQYFIRAYAHLKVANCILEQIEAEQLSSVKRTAITAVTDDIWQLIRGQPLGCMRTMFAQAICAEGTVDYTAKFSLNRKSVHLRAPQIVVNKIALELANRLSSYGIEHVRFMSPFKPTTPVGLVVGEYLISADYNAVSAPYIYNISSTIVPSVDLQNEYTSAFNRATHELKLAREQHMLLEKFYVPAMDFEDINKKTSQVIQRIFGNA